MNLNIVIPLTDLVKLISYISFPETIQMSQSTLYKNEISISSYSHQLLMYDTEKRAVTMATSQWKKYIEDFLANQYMNFPKMMYTLYD